MCDICKLEQESARKKLDQENARLREALESMQDDAINDDSLNYTAKWIKRARQALQGKEDTQTYCKDCGITTKSGSGSARCPSCWDDRFGGKEE